MDQIDQQADPTRWRPRPAIARTVALGIVAAPLVLAVGLAVLVEMVIPEPGASLGRVAWWIGVIGLPTAVLFVFERAALNARTLPILLKMGLAFPGEAPKRLEIALRAANTRKVGRLLEQARTEGIADDPVVAADSIVVLTAALSAHDRTTQGHADRVRELTDLVGAELQLPGADLDRLRWAALLHDIGKLSVHGEFLNKTGRLSSAERELVRRHTLEGAKIVEPLSGWLGEWALAIPEHHERHDGRGYPYGLEGEEISLGGRIVAVVDAYDVMTSGRSYKKPATPDAARAEIARLSGAQFDPVVVRAFLAVPVKQLHGLQPLAWLGSVRVQTGGPGLAALGRTAAAVVVAGSVLGLTAWRYGSPQHGVGAFAQSTGATGGNGGGSTDPQPGTPGTASSNAGVIGDPSTTSGSRRATTVQVVKNVGDRHFGDPRTRSGSSGPGGTSGGSASHRGGGPSGTSSPADPPPSTGGSPPPTTSGGSPPPTTGPPPPSTTGPPPPPTTGPPPPPTTDPPPPPTTDPPPPPPPPPPAPVTGLQASSTCTNVVLGPQVNLRWRDSTSRSVTNYEILRSSNGSSYSAIAEVSARSTSYSDSNVQGLGTTYWYKVEARGPDGSATSSAVSVTTPLTCL